MDQPKIIEEPTIERLFRRLIDGMGYHDAEAIPTKAVFEMFKAFFEYEHRWNTQLAKLLNEHVEYTIGRITVEKTR